MDLNYFCVCLFLALVVSLVVGKPSPSRPKQEKNFSFAIPAFLLGGGGIGNVNPNAVNNGNLPNINSNTNNNNNNNNQFNQNQNTNINLFRQVTVTRTILSTVATVTQPVFRTCTAPIGALLPCAAAGRRKRSVDGDADAEDDASADTLSMVLVMGSTTLTDQSVVSKLLQLDHGLQIEMEPVIANGTHQGNGTQQGNGSVPARSPSPPPGSLKVVDPVVLYPSDDVTLPTPNADELEGIDPSQDLPLAGLETPGLNNVVQFSAEVNQITDLARLGLGGTTTVSSQTHKSHTHIRYTTYTTNCSI